MKKLYGNIVTGAFIMRTNRFVIHAEIDGRMEICHMPNPGRMRELLFPGVKMYLVKSRNPLNRTAIVLSAWNVMEKLFFWIHLSVMMWRIT